MVKLTSKKQPVYCVYYQATVERTLTWFLVAILKSIDHLAFDRTLDSANDIIEFFVPPNNEHDFLMLMSYFQKQNIVHTVQKYPNRLCNNVLEEI